MKIGIITLPLRYNYGGILQAYALEEVLRRKGHEVEHIQIKKEQYLLSWKTRYLVYLKRAFNKYVKGKKIIIFRESYHHRHESEILQHTNAFMDKYLKRRFIHSFDEIKEGDYDCFVVGSDQVWRSQYICKKKKDYSSYLGFAEGWNVKRFAYACSFANDFWEYDKESTAEVSRLAKYFDAISVRENSGVKLCKQNLGVDAVHVLDPTMLLDKEDYIKLVENANTPQSPGNLLCYILDENAEHKRFIDKIAAERKLVPFRVNSKAENLEAGYKERIQPPVEKWLRGFMDAELVITDSFHACVFSIIFNKPFICLGNKKRGSGRFDSLFSVLNQSHRLINVDDSDLPATLYSSPDVDLRNYRKESLTLINKL